MTKPTHSEIRAALDELSKADHHIAEPEVGIMTDGYYLGGLTGRTYEIIKSLLEQALLPGDKESK